MTTRFAGALCALALLAGSCTGGGRESPSPHENGKSIHTRRVRFESSPPAVVFACREAQAAAAYTILCPAHLPRNWRSVVNCQPPTAAHADALVERGRAYGVDITHGSLHFGILGAGGPHRMGPEDHWDLVGERTLAGREGTLYYAPHDEMAYHAGHLVFYFHAREHLYAASLHVRRQSGWDERDLSELERLLRSLRPVNKLPLVKSGQGELGSRLVGKPLRISELSDAVMGRDVLWAESYSASKVFRIAKGAAGEAVRVPRNPYRGMLLLGGKLWVSSAGAGTVVGLDGRSGKRLHTVATGKGAADLAVLEGTLWVLNVLDATITRIDPATGETLGSPLEVPGRPVALESTNGRLWVVDCASGSLLEIDPDFGETVGSVEIGRGANDVEAFDGSIWISDWSAGTVVRVNPATARVVAEIHAGDTPGRLAGGSSSLWIADPRGRRILRVDPTSNRVVETLSVGESPFGVAVGNSMVWVLDAGKLLRVRVARTRG
jgi:streptogramin lyase